MTSNRVLIIDDAETIRRSVMEALEPAGFSVVAACDGLHGIALLQETSDLCLVLIDLNMPGMSGLGVLEWMRKSGSNHLAHAVLMTTEMNSGMVEQAKNAGAAGWLVKPCTPQQLIAVAKRMAAKQSVADAP